jgi:type VI secretion system protein ImpA
MPITDGSGGAWSAIDFESARRQGGDERRIAELDAAKRGTSAAFRRAFAADTQACLDALLDLERVADRRLGHDAPGFVSARDAIRDMQDLVPAPAEDAAPAAAENAAAAAPGEVAVPAAAPGGPPGAIHTRQQAIAQLRTIAEFFRRTEPHSPVSYYAEKAATAGEQDLHTWLRSVVKDSASLAHIEELLGVQPDSN